MVEQSLRERKKQRTRESIAAIALDLFAERGYQEVTVSEIAEAAEVSKGTLFAYFPSKEDIVFADTALRHDRLVRELEQRPGGLPAVETLRGCVIDLLQNPSPFARRRERLIEQNEVLRVHYRANVARVEDALAAAFAADSGEQPGDLRPRLLAAAVMTAFTVAKEHAYRTRGRKASLEEANAVVDEALAILTGGFDTLRPAAEDVA